MAGGAKELYDKVERNAKRMMRKRKHFMKKPIVEAEQELIVVKDIRTDTEFKDVSIVSTKKLRGYTLVTHILCPRCDSILSYNEHWNSFVCRECNDGNKHIYDVIG